MRTIEDFSERGSNKYDYFERTKIYSQNLSTIFSEAFSELATAVTALALTVFLFGPFPPGGIIPLASATASYAVSRLALPLFDKKFVGDIKKNLCCNSSLYSKAIIVAFAIYLYACATTAFQAPVIAIAAGIYLCLYFSGSTQQPSAGFNFLRLVRS